MFDVIEQNPERLTEITGVGAKRRSLITSAWSEQKAVREIMVFLHSHGVGSSRAFRIYKTYGDAALDPPKVFRIHRDVRFSRDKAPYKTNIGGFLPIAGRGSSGVPGPVALYVQLGTENYVGAGNWIMEPAQLAAYRAALLDERRGGELTKLLAKLGKAGFAVGSHDALKKVPRGFAPEHPRAELAKRKGLVVAFPELPLDLLTSRELVDWLARNARSAAVLVEWLRGTSA